MPDIFERLYKIARGNVLNRIHRFQERNQAQKNQTRESFTASSSAEYQTSDEQRQYDAGHSKPENEYSGVPRQVAEDLALFNLKHPTSLAAVKSARNRELKKYHSDKFSNDPEKFKISKEIMQIYNAAYERLSAYYRFS